MKSKTIQKVLAVVLVLGLLIGYIPATVTAQTDITDAVPNQPYSIPAFTGELERSGEPKTTAAAPRTEASGASGGIVLNENAAQYGITAAPPAYGVEVYPSEQLYLWPDASVPGTATLVGTPSATSLFAGDFMGADFSKLYAVSYDNNGLYSVDTATAVSTLIGTTTPPTGATFGGLAGADGIMYGIATNCNVSSTLVTVNLATAATTTIGLLPNATCIIDIAYVPSTGMLYGVDLVTASLYKIDPATGIDTVVGSLGISPNYAQGMDYDEVNEVLYWASYTDSSALRIIDINTGASALVGTFVQDEIDAFSIAAAAATGDYEINGTVTAVGGAPIEGANVLVTGGTTPRSLTTDEFGEYSLMVDAGEYTLTASKAGYLPETKTATVTEGATAPIVVDFELEVLPDILVTGAVYDGGMFEGPAHGYPLYARMTFTQTGFEEVIYTDPFTGEYELTLSNGQEYNLKIEAMVGGYEVLNTTITPTGAIAFEQDFYLYIDIGACNAPGYSPDYKYYFDFENSDGGFVSSGTNSSWAWGTITSGPGTGHSGTKGIATNLAGSYNASELSYMTSPVMDLTSFGTASPIIQWWDWKYFESVTYDNITLEVTKNGGTTWTAVWGPAGGMNDTGMPYSKQTVALDPTYNVANFQLRFKMVSDGSVQYLGAYIDDLGVGKFEIPPATVIYEEDFETDDGGYIVSIFDDTITEGPASWAWGTPSATPGPGAAHSGTKVWATNLTGNYNNYERSRLTSPVIDLSSYAGSSIILDFWQWMDTESNTYDWGAVEVSKDGGGTWTTVYEKFGDIMPWTFKEIVLDPSYAVENFQMRFYLRTDVSGEYPGWYIDDIRLSYSAPYTIGLDCNATPGGVVAGYVYDGMVEDTLLYGAKVASEESSALTQEESGHPASDGLYWLFQPFLDYGTDAAPIADIQSLSGSFLEFYPVIGGDEDYTPGEPGTFCFKSESFTSDWEYLYADFLKFPTNWTISSVAKAGTPFCTNGGTVSATFSWLFETSPYEVKVSNTRTHSSTDHCTTYFCVDATPGAGAGDALVSWYYDGDGFGDPPNHPCSDDVYTPGSMASEPCDEHIHPQASIPLGAYSEEILFTASMENYESLTEAVRVMPGEIVQKDWELSAGMIVADPLALERTLALFDDPETTILTLENIGGTDAGFTIEEKNVGFQPYHIPPFNGELESAKDVVATADTSASTFGTNLQLQAASDSILQLEGGPMAYVVEVRSNDKLFRIPDITVPGTWEAVASAGTYYAGDFLKDDYSQIYAITDTDVFHSIDTTTGLATTIAQLTVPGVGGGGVQGIAGANGFFYGTTSNCSSGSDIFTLSPTGDINIIVNTSIACGIDIAYVPDNGLLYIVDIITDHLYSVNPNTAEVIDVGALGFDAGYAQGMDYDEANKILYWAAYGSGGNGQLRAIDMETGASTLVGAFPGDNESDCLAIAAFAGGGGGGGGGAVPWLDEDPIEGVVSAYDSAFIDIEFNVDGIEQPGDYFAELVIDTDTPYEVPPIPVTMHVIRPLNWGSIKGTVYGFEQCDINPTLLEEALINFYRDGELVQSTLTDEDGYFSWALLNGTYDIEIIYAGYVTQMLYGVNLGWDEEVVLDDIYLRLDAACLTYNPESFFQDLYPEDMAEQTLTFTNFGAREAVFEIIEKDGGGPVPFAMPKLADVELILDDGSLENSIGLTAGGDFLWANRFTPSPDQIPFTLDMAQVAWNNTVAVSDNVTIAVFFDADGDPSNGATYLGKMDSTVQNISGAFVNYEFDDPIQITAPGDVLIAVINRSGAPEYSDLPAALDQTGTLHQRSWIGLYSGSVPEIPTLPPDNTWAIIDTLGFAGNWMIRGMGTAGGGSGGDIIWLTVDPMAEVVLPDGGSVDVTLTFDSTGLTWGDYFGVLDILNAPDPKITIPVQLRVWDFERVYMPFTFTRYPHPAKQ